MSDDIVTRLRYIYSQKDVGVSLNPETFVEAADEIERLRKCLQHAIDHVGKWQLFTAEEKQSLIAEYEKAVRGD